MYCKVLKCENNEDGYCCNLNYLTINEDGNCDSMLILSNETEAKDEN